MAAAQAAAQEVASQEEEDDGGPMLVDILEENGINATDVAKLKLAGFFTLDRYAGASCSAALRGFLRHSL